jgi:hypothetical protein
MMELLCFLFGLFLGIGAGVGLLTLFYLCFSK